MATPRTTNRPSWSIPMTRNRSGRLSPLHRHLRDRLRTLFPSDSESTPSSTPRSRRRARNTAPGSMLKMLFCFWPSRGMLSSTPPLSKTLFRRLTIGLRPACRSNLRGKPTSYSSLDQSLPRFYTLPTKCHLTPRCYANLQNRVGLSVPPTSNSAYLTLTPPIAQISRASVHLSPTATSSMGTSWFASCVSYYVPPLPPFLASTQIRTNLEPNAS